MVGAQRLPSRDVRPIRACRRRWRRSARRPRSTRRRVKFGRRQLSTIRSPGSHCDTRPITNVVPSAYCFEQPPRGPGSNDSVPFHGARKRCLGPRSHQVSICRREYLERELRFRRHFDRHDDRLAASLAGSECVASVLRLGGIVGGRFAAASAAVLNAPSWCVPECVDVAEPVAQLLEALRAQSIDAHAGVVGGTVSSISALLRNTFRCLLIIGALVSSNARVRPRGAVEPSAVRRCRAEPGRPSAISVSSICRSSSSWASNVFFSFRLWK